MDEAPQEREGGQRMVSDAATEAASHAPRSRVRPGGRDVMRATRVDWFSVSRWCLLGAVVLPTVLFVPFLGSVSTALLIGIPTILVLAAAAAWTIGTLASGACTIPRVSRNAHIALGVTVVGAIVATLAAPSRRVAFWGGDGLEVDAALPLGLALITLLLAAVLFRNPRDLRRALMVLLGAAGCSLALVIANHVALLAFQRPLFGTRLVHYTPVGTMHVFATFIGAACTIAFAWAVGLAPRSPKGEVGEHGSRRAARAAIAAVVVAFLTLAIIHHAQSFIALAAAVIVALALWLLRHGPSVSTHLLRLNTFLLVAALALLLTFAGPRVDRLLRHPGEIFPSTRTSAIVVWDSFRADPLRAVVGMGPATYGFTYQRTKPLALNLSPLGAFDFRQATSVWWTLLTSFGVVTALGILGFLALLLVRGYRAALAVSRRSAGAPRGASAEWGDGTLEICATLTTFLVVVSLLYPTSTAMLLVLALSIGMFTAAATASDGAIAIPLYRTPLRAIGSSLLLTAVVVGTAAVAVVTMERVVAAVMIRSTARAMVTARAAGQPLDREATIAGYARAARLFRTDTHLRTLSALWFGELGARAAALTPENAETMRPQIQGAFNTAVRLARSAAELQPADHRNWALMGDIYANVVGVFTGADRAALDAYAEAGRRYATAPRYPIAIARVRIAQAEKKIVPADEALPAAEDALAEALRLKPDATDALLLLAQVAERRGNLPAAIAKTAEALRQQPNAIGILFTLGALQYKAKDFDAAQASFERAVRVSPNYANARYFLGRIAEDRGDRDAALAYYEAVRAFNAGNDELSRRIRALRGYDVAPEEPPTAATEPAPPSQP